MRDHTLDPALYIKVLLFSAFLAINVIFSLKNGMSSIDHDLNNYFYFYVSALSGIGAIIIFSTFLQSARYLSFVGRNTLIILCIHNPIKRIVIKIVATIVHLPVNPFRNSLLGGLICALATTAATIPFIFLINRYFPFLLGKFGGNRLSRKEVDVRGWHARKNVNN